MPARTVHHGGAIAWLADPACLVGASVITSLPDASELPELGLPGWRRWFEDAAALLLERLGDDGVAIFHQTDIREGGAWIDKGQLVARGAERAGASLLFHRIVCRRPPGTVSQGRATYAHQLGYARRPRPLRHGFADVLADAGAAPGPKSMGVLACRAACRVVLDETPTRTVVDPFCGHGTVLAVANALGLDAVGVDRSLRMVRRARALSL